MIPGAALVAIINGDISSVIEVMNSRRASGTLLLLIWSIVSARSAFCADGATTFNSKCASCHTVGGGNLVGPDLAKVKDWAEVDLTSTVERMQSMAGPLTPDEIKSLVGFLKSAKPQSASSAPSPDAQTAAKPQAESKKEEHGSAENGRKLFTGKLSFQNGGMSCISCHSSAGEGGTVGLDLTHVANKMPEAALISACESTPFPVMKSAYSKHPITHQEAVDLAAYFETTKSIEGEKRPANPTWIAGTAIATIALAAIAFGYRKRNSSVRKKLRRR